MNNRLFQTVSLLISALLFGVLYHQTYAYMVKEWGKDDFTYCAIVPFIVLYLLWEKRAEFLAEPAQPSWLGLLAFLPGILLYLLGELGGEYFTLNISSWLVLVGLLWLRTGWRKLKTIGFPLLFLMAMFPLPNVIFSNLSLKLKLISSQLGVAIIQLAGLTAFREGNVIDLGFTRLQVVDACNGLRYLLPLLVLGILLAYYYSAAFWKRALVVVSSVPLAVITNGLRIASVGFLYPIWGAKAAEGFFHDFSGWLIFMVSLAFLLGEIWLLKRLFPEKGDAAPGQQAVESKPGELPGSFGPARAIIPLVILLVCAVTVHSVDFREKTPLAKPLIEFPLQLGEWRGSRSALDRETLEALHLSDYLMADYRNAAGRSVNLYVAYNESQRKGASSHSPATCLPGSGWIFGESGTTLLKMGGAVEAAVRRAFMQKSGDRMLVYYWFPQRGRFLTGLLELKLYAFWDALTRRRTDGALVRILTPVYPDEGQEQAEQRLRQFAADAVPALNTFLPGR